MTWSLKTAVASSVAGLMIMAAVVIDFLLPPAAGAVGVALTAETIGASNALGFAGNLANASKDDPSSSDAQTKKIAKCTVEAHAQLDATKDNLISTMTSEENGPDGIYEMFKSGAWVSPAVRDLIQDGLQAKFSGWLHQETVAPYFSRVLKDINAYILFKRYPDNAPYSERKWHITQQQCEDRYKGNPHWKYAVVCDATYQPGVSSRGQKMRGGIFE